MSTDSFDSNLLFIFKRLLVYAEVEQRRDIKWLIGMYKKPTDGEIMKVGTAHIFIETFFIKNN